MTRRVRARSASELASPWAATVGETCSSSSAIAPRPSGATRASMFTTTFRCAVPSAPVTSASASSWPTRSPGSPANSARSGGTGSIGSTPMRSGAGRAPPVAGRNDSTCSASHSASGPAAITTCARRTASVRWRASIAGTICGSARQPCSMSVSVHSSSSTGHDATTWAHRRVAAGGHTGRGSTAGGVIGAAGSRGTNAARRTVVAAATSVSMRSAGLGAIASATTSPIGPSITGGSRRSVPSRATVTSSSQCTSMLGSMVVMPPPRTTGRRGVRCRPRCRRGTP